MVVGKEIEVIREAVEGKVNEEKANISNGVVVNHR